MNIFLNLLVNFWNGNEWKWEILSLTMPSDIVTKAFTIRPKENTCDRPYLSLNSNGLFSTKSARQLLESTDVPQYTFEWIWSLKTLNKIQFFLWLCYHNMLPTNMYLHHIGLSTDPSCPLCHSSPEAIEHLFLNCYIVRKFWLDLGLNMHFIINTHTH